MSDKPSTPSQPPTSSKAPQKPTYISSSGHTLSSLPLSARLNRFVDNAYNFLGLYIVSLLSLDPYTAAQNSRFNTRGPGRNPGTGAGSTTTGGGSGLFGGGRSGGGGGGGSGSSAGPRGGSGGSGGGSSGRRVGTVDDVRGPECGSCG